MRVNETPDTRAWRGDQDGAIAGDVIHSTRTALDHLAYQLVLVGTGRSGPFKRVYFPIADSAVEYEAAKTKETRLMPAAAMTAIDALVHIEEVNQPILLAS